MAHSVPKARFVKNIHISTVQNGGHKRLKMFPVIRIPVIVPVGKTVVIIEVFRRIKRADIGKYGVYIRNFRIA